MAKTSRGRLSSDAGPFTWVRNGPYDGRPLLLLAHGSGAPYTHRFLEAVVRGLVDRGITVVRFHFPYMERMVAEGKRRPPDRAPVLMAAWRAMIRRSGRFRNAGPLFLAGKSLGGRMASMVLAEGGVERARGAVYFGYPLHPAGKPERLRSEHLPLVPVPQLFVQGTRDPLCDLDLLEPVLRRLGTRARLHVVDRGDHSLATSRKNPLAGSEVWLDAVAGFIQLTVGTRRGGGTSL